MCIRDRVEEDGKRERGASGGGGRFGYEFFLADLDGEVRADAWAKEAVRMAPVSYTHLDVYKRQILRPSSWKPLSLFSQLIVAWPSAISSGARNTVS